jgi:hypothetical protein
MGKIGPIVQSAQPASDKTLNINNPPLASRAQKITVKDTVLRQNTPPVFHLDRPPGAGATNPKMILKTFGLDFARHELYKGRIPISTPDESPISRRSQLGSLIFSDLQFLPINGTSHIPVDIALFDVHQAKLITRTAIQGRKGGQIKEYNGEDDFEITIKGVICGSNGRYPIDQVKNLVQFCRYPQSLGIVSKYLNEVWDISEVVIYDYHFEMPEGSHSYQKFELQCWSDKPVEILIKEAKS